MGNYYQFIQRTRNKPALNVYSVGCLELYTLKFHSIMLGISGNRLAVEVDYSAGDEIAGEQINKSETKDYDY